MKRFEHRFHDQKKKQKDSYRWKRHQKSLPGEFQLPSRFSFGVENVTLAILTQLSFYFAPIQIGQVAAPPTAAGMEARKPHSVTIRPAVDPFM
jgi:hypothetical protein